MLEMRVRLTFTEEILGTASNDEEIYANFIGSKSPNAPSIQDEIESIGVDGVTEKGTTVFSKDADGKPFLWDYQIRGFFKNAAKSRNYYMKKKLVAYKTKIDGLVFINERKIPLNIPEGEAIGNCQRPLRAETAQGPRVALASSESCPPGTTIEFTIKCLLDSLMSEVKAWLDYGELNGIGQWHNSGKGRFTWEEIKE